MKMNFYSTPRKISTIKPIVQPVISINREFTPTSHLFSSMLDRVQKTEGCSACGRK